MGGEPAVRCRSEAFRSMTWIRTSAKSNSITCPYLQRASSRDSRNFGDGRDAVFDLFETVETQRAHPLLHGDLQDLIGRRALDREGADLLGDLHHLVHAAASLVAGAAAAVAA